jgi:hypothetical protein
MRKFKVEIHEWYSKYDDASDKGHKIHKTFYIEQNEGEKKLLKMLKIILEINVKMNLMINFVHVFYKFTNKLVMMKNINLV